MLPSRKRPFQICQGMHQQLIATSNVLWQPLVDLVASPSPHLSSLGVYQLVLQKGVYQLLSEVCISSYQRCVSALFKSVYQLLTEQQYVSHYYSHPGESFCTFTRLSLISDRCIGWYEAMVVFWNCIHTELINIKTYKDKITRTGLATQETQWPKRA